MENTDIQERITEIEQEIEQLPKGSISKKTIGGRDYYYHRLNDKSGFVAVFRNVPVCAVLELYGRAAE